MSRRPVVGVTAGRPKGVSRSPFQSTPTRRVDARRPRPATTNGAQQAPSTGDGAGVGPQTLAEQIEQGASSLAGSARDQIRTLQEQDTVFGLNQAQLLLFGAPLAVAALAVVL